MSIVSLLSQSRCEVMAMLVDSRLVKVEQPNESADRREKLTAYTKISCLLAYLIVDQGSQWVQLHARDEQGQWLHADFISDGVIPVPTSRLLSSGGYSLLMISRHCHV